MLQLHPQVLTKDSRNAFAVQPYEEYEQLRTVLEDAQDLLTLREAQDQEGNAPGRPLDEVLREIRCHTRGLGMTCTGGRTPRSYIADLRDASLPTGLIFGPVSNTITEVVHKREDRIAATRRGRFNLSGTARFPLFHAAFRS